MNALNNIRLSVKLPAMITGATLITAIAVGLVGYLAAKSLGSEAFEEKIDALLTTKQEELLVYLTSIEQDLKIVSSAPATVQAVKEFDLAWRGLGENQTRLLQDAYIDNNPNPTGEKEKLDAARTGTTYDTVHLKYHPWFRKLLKERSYYDIFLLNLNGDLIYSVFKELDYATNLQNGKYFKTDLGNAFRAALQSNEAGSLHFFDFKPYAPSHGAPASFISTPVYERGEKIGVLVFQMPVDIINSVMSSHAGLGKTGELLIVGSDNLLRNDSSYSKGNDILKTKIDNEAVSSALSGKKAFAISSSYRDIELKYEASPFSYHGTTWAIVGAQAVSEVTKPIVSLRNAMLGIATALILVITIVGFLVCRGLTRPISKLVGEAQQLAGGDTSVPVEGQGRNDEIGDIAKAIAVFKQNAIERINLESESEADQRKRAERQARIEGLIEAFRNQVRVSLQSVSGNAEQMQSAANSLNETAHVTTKNSNAASESTSLATSNVQAVAAASDQLNASISEIDRQVLKTRDLVAAAATEGQQADEKVAGLSSAAEKIDTVISLIQDIAEQTNLLALNATIEAARAGEAGKGFAVVASEVKGLATQTAKATEDIASQISNIQTETSGAVGAIQSIVSKIGDVNEYTAAIATAIEEQGAATSEIGRNVHEAVDRTRDVSDNVGSVSASIDETTRSASQVLSASQTVTTEASKMTEIVEDFLKEVAAA